MPQILTEPQRRALALLATMREYHEDEIYLEADMLAALVNFARRCGIEVAK